MITRQKRAFVFSFSFVFSISVVVVFFVFVFTLYYKSCHFTLHVCLCAIVFDEGSFFAWPSGNSQAFYDFFCLVVDFLFCFGVCLPYRTELYCCAYFNLFNFSFLLSQLWTVVHEGGNIVIMNRLDWYRVNHIYGIMISRIYMSELVAWSGCS